MDNFRDSYFPVTWDLTKKHLRGTFWGKQYDTGRGFAVTIVEGGQVTVPSTETVRLKWEKPDSTEGYVTAVVVDDKFLIEDIDQMFTVHGAVRSDLEIWRGGKVISSITFYVSVEKAVAVDAIESSSQFTALQEALADVGDITEVKSQLAQKASKTHVWPMANMGQDVKEAMTGGSVAVVGKDTVLEENIVDKQVTPRKVSFVEESRNLFNKETVTPSKRINDQRVIVDSIEYDLGDYMPVEGNTQYTSSHYVEWQKFTAEKEPLGGAVGKMSETTTGLTRFIRVNVRKEDLDSLQIEKGESVGSYQPYGSLYIPNLNIETGTDEEQVNQLIDDKINQYDIQIQQIIDDKIAQRETQTGDTKSPTSLLSFEEIPTSPAIYAQNFKSQETGKIYSRGVAGVYEWNSIENDEFRLCGVDVSSMTGAIEYMHVTSEFVVYVTRDIPTLSTFIYRADNVDVENPTLVHSYVGGYPTSMHCASYRDENIDVILVGTYNHESNPSSSLPLFMSTDKGMTWQKIHETPVIDNTTNSHWHSAAYDPYSDMIWAGYGDGANRGITWSYDMGQTWDRIQGVDQPTMILPFEDRVIFGRDASTKKPGLDGYERKETAHEVELYDALTFREDQPGNWNYPQHNFWADTDIGYVLFSPTTAPLSDMQYIYATGDGGKTWHLVWSVHRDELRIERITGISEDGYIVATVLGHDTIPSNSLIKAKAVSWT